jgi:phospholipid/cholesterol/gamma-HCH transport system ATP-binding protein
MTAPLRFEDIALGGTGPERISLVVPACTTVSLVGEVATGVQRLGAIALGLEHPAGGRALVFGEDIAVMPRSAALAFRRRVGYVPEGDGLLQNLSLADNVALPLRFGSALSPREIEGRLRVMLAAVRLREAARLRPADADDEQRRRAALARAIAFDPDLVILVDPFNGIGTRAAVDILELARGGENDEGGSHRAVFLTGQMLPERVRARIETRFRIAGGALQPDA